MPTGAGGDVVQIAVLEEGVHRVRMEYNERFLALRDVKRSLCERLRDKYARLAEANAGLGVDDAPQPPRMRPEEEPEKRLNVTDADVDAYLREQAAAGGTGGDGGARSAGAEAGRGEGAAEVKGIETPAEAVARMAASTPLSPLEKAAKTVRERQLVRPRRHPMPDASDLHVRAPAQHRWAPPCRRRSARACTKRSRTWRAPLTARCSSCAPKSSRWRRT